MKLFDITDVVENLSPDLKCHQVYLQEDTWVFHVYRVFKEKAHYAVEHEKIEKNDVIAVMKVDLGGLDIREAFRYLDDLDTAKAVVKLDEEKGYDTWSTVNANTMEEVMAFITEDGAYPVETMLYEETELETPHTEKGLHYNASMRDAEAFLMKLMTDERSLGYDNVVVTTYQNGREQGYVLSFEEWSITFSVMKGTDAFVVYHGAKSDVTLSEEAYQNSKAFGERHFNAAANYVFELLAKQVPKTENKETFTFSPSLQTARDIIHRLFLDPRSKAHAVAIEGLQKAPLTGLSLYLYENFGNSSMIGISSEDGQIVLYFGPFSFQGVDEKSTKETLLMKDIDKAVDTILTYIKTNSKQHAG